MVTTSDSGLLDEILWQTRNTMTLPEGFRAEIIEEAVEVSPTGALRHLKIATRLRRALDAHLSEEAGAPERAMGTYQDGNVIHGRKVYIPDVFVAPADIEEASDPEGLGVDVAHVPFVAEVVSDSSTPPGRAGCVNITLWHGG
ncbi:Uma2 family endonuclease [Streptomyces sp. SID3343]|uniref:Uma2 family endonuclease n=1 Tax=Streptomyces sp. SID3343 TaxID=2690260 RepID=UPI001F35F795|nr:Uma2 family endonuclease [Streptomyces sp. SID3343]